jgi:hypothetical protein
MVTNKWSVAERFVEPPLPWVLGGWLLPMYPRHAPRL